MPVREEFGRETLPQALAEGPKLYARIAGALALAAGVLVLFGWARGIGELKSVLPGLTPMKPWAAVAFILAGLPLALPPAPARRGLVAIGAALVLIGLVTLAEFATGFDFGIDTLLFEQSVRAESVPHPGRMAASLAICVTLLGAAFVRAEVVDADGRWRAQWPAVAALAVALVGTIGYLYSPSALAQTDLFTGMALHAAVLVLLLGSGFLCAHPERGLMRWASAEDPGGVLIRRLLSAVVLVPIALGGLRLLGEKAGLYGTEFGLAMFAAANIAIFAALIWWTARSLSLTDAERRAAERKLQLQYGRLDLLNHITRAVGERQDLASIFQVVVRSVEDGTAVDFCCLCTYDPVSHHLTVAYVGTKSEPFATHLKMSAAARVPIDENGLARCVRGNLVYEPDIAAVAKPFPQRLAGAGLRSFVAAPLQMESKVFGVLLAARRDAEAFSSGECEFLRQLAEHVALATHHAQLYGALQQAYEDLRQTQQAMVQQERLRALGQMASGIAHDINNAMAPAALYVESLLENEAGLSARAREQLATVQRAMDDVVQSVVRMREFYRQREPQVLLTVVDLNRLAGQVLELTRARWSNIAQEQGIVIETRTDLTPELPPVMGVESEIRDALTNLVFNAVDAMPQGGTLTLRTAVERRSRRRERAAPVQHVQIEVSDTGSGMDAETLQHCMEPFYTTKGERGTGLGLAMVYGIVQRHSAEIAIDSEPGKGTSVRLTFLAAGADRPAATWGESQERVPTRLRLLVVDDDPLMIRSLQDTLETDGHLVMTANAGQTGIDAFHAAQRRGEPFAAVITDLGMPYVDGRRVASAVKAASPRTPVILLTGWGRRMEENGEIPPSVDLVLSKPPRLRDLREALAALVPQ